MSKVFYEKLLQALQESKRARSVTILDGELPEAVSKGHSWLFVDDEVCCGTLGQEIDTLLIEKLKEVSRRSPTKVVNCDLGAGPCRLFIELHDPTPRLLLVGAGHIAQSMAYIADHLGFQIRVFDDRKDFVVPELFPEGTELVHGLWPEVGEKMTPGQTDFVVIVTHAHSGDGEALVSLLEYDVAYLGMIGSKRKVKALLEKAKEKGCDAKKLEKVFSPIGLAIAAETPAEIAISILAEIVAVARGADPGQAGSCSITGRKG